MLFCILHVEDIIHDRLKQEFILELVLVIFLQNSYLQAVM